MLKANYGLTFTGVGLITLSFQLTASLLQPRVGYHTDRHLKPWLLPAGSLCTLVGILIPAFVGSFPAIPLASGLVGIGSSIFHPEPSRIARLASAGALARRNHFQVGVTPAAPSHRRWPRPSSCASARAMSPGSRCSPPSPSGALRAEPLVPLALFKRGRRRGLRSGAGAGQRRHVAGLFFSHMSGLGGVGAARLKQLADLQAS